MRLKPQQLNSADTEEHCSVTQNPRERKERERESRTKRKYNNGAQQNWRVDISQLKRGAAIEQCSLFLFFFSFLDLLFSLQPS